MQAGTIFMRIPLKRIELPKIIVGDIKFRKKFDKRIVGLVNRK
jgi:hypothetical protein